MLNKHSVCVNY